MHPVDATKGKPTSDGTNKYRYRIVVMDAKSTKRGPEYDLSFSPALPTDNEEQAKEEAAILALLHLTPKIPHDRKLPEPYKTTFLNAVQHQQQQQQKKTLSGPTSSMTNLQTKSEKIKPSRSSSSLKSTDTNKSSFDVAKESQNLVMDRKFASLAEKKKHDQQKQLNIKAKITKQEAIREANKPYKVLMSQTLRASIEQLLRSNYDESKMENTVGDITDNTYLENSLVDGVEERLLDDGFTSKQIKLAISNLNSQQKKKQNLGQDLVALDVANAYEKCLQWLCIHVNEKFLPERFNPRGSNLDVIAAVPAASAKNKPMSTEVLNLCKTYGVLTEEAALLLQYAKGQSIQSTFWNCICDVAMKKDLCVESLDMDSDTINMNMEQIDEEIEALKAIFLDECEIIDDNASCNDDGIVKITLPLQMNQSLTSESGAQPTLEIHVRKGYYPTTYPSQVLIKNTWSTADQSTSLGTNIHIKLVEFIDSLNSGEPMIYEIFGFVTDLLEQEHEPFPTKSPLLLCLENNKESKNLKQRQPSNQRELSKGKTNKKLRKFRPKERSSFWSKQPNKAPPAKSYPTIPSAIENARKNLPAHSARNEFYRILEKSKELGSRVLLVTGETGCGKTTQIPQFILEKYPTDAKIVIAQPRRLAATGVATRVAAERGEDTPGLDSVGYVVRGDTAMCDRTRLMFCTTGVLLRQLQSENTLDCITHIVVDEVHERHLDTDILLGILKEVLPNNPHLHVILMSATMDADRFAAYWGRNTPRMHIPGFTYPVQDYGLEDVLSLTGYIPPRNGKKKSNRSSNALDGEEKSSQIEPQDEVEELVQRVQENSIDYNMLASLVKRLVEVKKYDDDGAILVFLPGAPEISKAEQSIRRNIRNASILLLPLHGGLQAKDQKLVFNKPKLGITKVVLSTNVAETSITIPDITIVIDTCKEKQSSYDPVNRMPMLVERFASKDSLRQRRGRAGRVRPGTCYKLISKKTLDKLAQHGEPEIRRCALDQTLLSLLFLDVEKGSGNFLEKLLDPPSRESIDAALNSLRKLGAIVESSITGEVVLTPLGMHLAGIPAPPCIGKCKYVIVYI